MVTRLCESLFIRMIYNVIMVGDPEVQEFGGEKYNNNCQVKIISFRIVY